MMIVSDTTNNGRNASSAQNVTIDPSESTIEPLNAPVGIVPPRIG